MKNYVRILGWFYIVTCGLALALGLTLCVLLTLDTSARSRTALQFIGPLFLSVALLVLLPGLVGGIGLLRCRRWGRNLLLLPSALFLPLPPIGTMIGIYGFWILLNPQTQALFDATEPAANKVYPRAPSPVLRLLGVMACVAAGFFLVLKVGFIVHHDPQPSPIDSNALTAAAILLLVAGSAAATVLAIQSAGRVQSNARMRKNFKEKVSAQTAARYRRAAELAADPAKAQYAPRVERGENWSDEQIAYYESPDMTVTCSHLQPIERAMREAGVNVRWYKEADVIARCHIDFAALQRAFHAGLPVRYAEFFQGDPESHEYPAAYLTCDVHKSIIHTLHPEKSEKEAVWFPLL